MKKILFLLFVAILSLQTSAQTAIFNDLLQEFVSKEGLVNYKDFNDKKLSLYLDSLVKTTPNKTWSENKQKAFWINVYNAYTIHLIIQEKQSKNIKNSILDIKINEKSAWKIPFVKVGYQTYTLDQIEHEILRKKYPDPRIHVGVNCASISCPKLSNIAFTEENIDVELEKLMIAFINDSTKNKISKNKIEISKIFTWFEEDFTKKGSIIDFLNQYSEPKISRNTKTRYLAYDWNLNEK